MVAVFALSYLAWLRWHAPDVKSGQVVTATPAPAVENEPQIAIQPKQVIVYRDTVRVVEKLGLPPAAPQEKVQQAVAIPELKYGGTAATFINTSTGQSRTIIKASEAPWLAFRNDLAIGIGAGVGTQGNTMAVRIRYDVAQVKGVTISPELEGNYAANRKDQNEGRAMLWVEWRK